MDLAVSDKDENKDEFLLSDEDKEIFFNALMGEEHQPNDSLLEAIKFHNEMISE